MNQHEAPVGTIALLGHPANDERIVKTGAGWIHLRDAQPVDPEAFRVGWDIAPALNASGQEQEQTPPPAADATARVDDEIRWAFSSGGFDDGPLPTEEDFRRVRHAVAEQRRAERRGDATPGGDTQDR